MAPLSNGCSCSDTTRITAQTVRLGEHGDARRSAYGFAYASLRPVAGEVSDLSLGDVSVRKLLFELFFAAIICRYMFPLLSYVYTLETLHAVVLKLWRSLPAVVRYSVACMYSFLWRISVSVPIEAMGPTIRATSSGHVPRNVFVSFIFSAYTEHWR